MESESPKDVWYAINWKGELGRKECKTAPKPEEFKIHFENLLLSDATDDVDSVVIGLLAESFQRDFLHFNYPNRMDNIKVDNFI